MKRWDMFGIDIQHLQSFHCDFKFARPILLTWHSLSTMVILVLFWDIPEICLCLCFCFCLLTFNISVFWCPKWSNDLRMWRKCVTKYSEWNSTQENVEIIRILRKNTEKGIVFHLLLFGPFSAINELWVKFANYIQKRTEILWEENEKWLKRCGTLDWSFTILIPLQRLLMKWVSSIYATKNLACDSQLFPSKHIWARWMSALAFLVYQNCPKTKLVSESKHFSE